MLAASAGSSDSVSPLGREDRKTAAAAAAAAANALLAEISADNTAASGLILRDKACLQQADSIIEAAANRGLELMLPLKVHHSTDPQL